MKNYVYKFEFISGFYEDIFYKQLRAGNEKEAILRIVSFFKNCSDEDAFKYLRKSLGFNWTVERFWRDMDLQFSSNEETEAYTLIWIKEVDFDLDYL